MQLSHAMMGTVLMMVQRSGPFCVLILELGAALYLPVKVNAIRYVWLYKHTKLIAAVVK